MTAVTLPPPRIATLDILRGIAVMGIFSVNVVAFSMPVGAYFNPAVYGWETPADIALWLVNFIVIDGKMRGLFSLLFGASMLLVIERADASGRSGAAVHYSRMVWLLVFGCLHFYLIWFGDILTLYASVGMIAFFFRKKPVRTLLVWAGIFLVIDLGLVAMGSYHFLALEAAAHAPGATREAVRTWAEQSAEFSRPDARGLAADMALYRGSYGGLVRHRLTEQGLGPAMQLVFAGAETLGYMLLGMAGLKSGFLKGDWDDRRYRRIAFWGLAIGMPAYAALAWIDWRAGFSGAAVFAVFIGAANPVRPVLMVGYAALIILATRRGGALTERIAAAGRAAFTNYLGTSIIATTVFYGYGLGLYGQLSRFETWLVAPLVWAAMLLWSKPWLDRFQYGPFEWLWRSLARWSPQPMRRRPAAAAA